MRKVTNEKHKNITQIFEGAVLIDISKLFFLACNFIILVFDAFGDLFFPPKFVGT